MTQTSSRIFDEMARLMNDAAGVASGVRREFDTLFKSQAERILRDLDVVKRDDFEAVREMAKIAREQAPQTSTQSPNVRAGDLPADIKNIVLGLKVSDASKPLPTRGGVGIIMVCKRTDPRSALPTQDQVYDELMHARLDQISRRYLRDLRAQAFVDVRV